MVPASSLPFVRVVLLDYNGGRTIVDAIEAITKTQWPSDRLEIVCVDNGSTDGSLEEIEHRYPSVVTMRNGSNLGFPGNNVAMRELDGVDYVALVNSDALVDPDWLTPLVERADTDKGIGAVCPKILLADRFIELGVAIRGAEGRTSNALVLRGVTVNGLDVFSRTHVANGGGRSAGRDGIFEWLSDSSVIRVPVELDEMSPTAAVDVVVDVEAIESCVISLEGREGVERAVTAGELLSLSMSLNLDHGVVDVVNNVGSWLDEMWIGHERGLYQVDRGQYDHPVDVGTWCGAAVLLRASHLADVGVFEESFFLYYEDTDLAVRGRGRGWRIVLEPSSVVRHIHSASTIEGSAVAAHHIERNRLLLVARHGSVAEIIREFVRYPLSTAAYARVSVAHAVQRRRRPDFTIVDRRTRSWFAALKMLPASLKARRVFAARRYVSRNELRSRLALGSSDSASGTENNGGLQFHP